MGKLIITVEEIRGNCPVYDVGDKLVLDNGFKFDLSQTDNICLHSLASILPYHVALYHGINPKQMGLAQQGPYAYVQCLDPCDYTGGGTVIFRIRRTEE